MLRAHWPTFQLHSPLSCSFSPRSGRRTVSWTTLEKKNVPCVRSCYTISIYTWAHVHNHFLIIIFFANSEHFPDGKKLFLELIKVSNFFSVRKGKIFSRHSPSRLMPTAMHFFSRQYWQRLRFTRWIMHCWFFVHGRYWIFCWMDRRKNPWKGEKVAFWEHLNLSSKSFSYCASHHIHWLLK